MITINSEGNRVTYQYLQVRIKDFAYVDCYKLLLYEHNPIFIYDIESLTLGH